MAGGQVLLYNADDGPPPNAAQYQRVPTLVLEIDPGDSFRASIPVGTYYFAAVKRNSGKRFGRPQPGDFSFRYYRPESRELNVFSIRDGEHLDFGTLEAHLWQEASGAATTGSSAAIEGTLTDSDGRPIENALVFAFSTPRMQGRRPKFISERTGRDGRYILQVAGDATYYLMVRDTMGGGRLREGETIGVHGAPKPVGVTVKAGERIQGIDIRATRMERRSPEAGAGTGQPPDPARQETGDPYRRPADLPTPPLRENSPEK